MRLSDQHPTFDFQMDDRSFWLGFNSSNGIRIPNVLIRSHGYLQRPHKSAGNSVIRNKGKTGLKWKLNCPKALENVVSDLIRRAVRAEIQEIVKLIRQQDRLLRIDEVAQQLSVSKDWVYRNGKKLTFTKKLRPKMVGFPKPIYRSG